VGIFLNPALPLRGLVGMALFIALNLFLSAGLRDLLRRLLARRRVREVVIFLLVIMAALPQLLLLRSVSDSLHRTMHSVWFGLAPWTAPPTSPWAAHASSAGLP
jgi:ABC-2 type transport system permease protein